MKLFKKRSSAPDPVEVYRAATVSYHLGGSYISSSDGPWRFRVKGANGEVVASSEGYTTKADAERGAATLKRLMQSHRP